ncbi:MAG: flavodoxin-dependent (E)-4-hydroxy-3-methylbut-2-enyl-diphosphate synthase [Clostridiaceae bacterium]|nr:flavodoxin-dependent (E)-4-hydroxy-3-methylbut-2-enyl-diphosphate synthase [Clostridiaceae bacterium]
MGGKTKQIMAGGVAIGGGAPLSIQSMTNTKTADAEGTLAQLERLAQAGCQIARLAVPDLEAARAFGRIRAKSPLPLVADIHFDYRLAVAAAEEGADKIRINPGNIGSPEGVKAVARTCREKKIPIRIGVNGGSLEKELLAKYGGPKAEALVESALGHIRLLNDQGFDDICVSLKSSNVMENIQAYRLMAEQTDYPLHLGVTEAGTRHMGLLKSAAAFSALLADGIGDTLRVSLTADPVEEVYAALDILKALGLHSQGAVMISCPTCGRTKVNLIPIAEEVERRLAGLKSRVTVAVMGCAVNGPGEAREADLGVACGADEGLIFAKGEIIGKAPAEQIVEALAEQVMLLTGERI